MESRPVILLTEGYLTGRLNFKYPEQQSLLREQFILRQIEQEKLLDLYKLKTLAQSIAFAVNPKEGTVATQKAMTYYSELSLPYIFKKDTIRAVPNAPSSPEEWKAILDSLE